MFKWRNKSSKISLEPKTPRLPSIPLHPDPPFIPMPYHHLYGPNPPLHFPQPAPMVDPRYSHTEPTSRKSRSRTMSTPSVKGILDLLIYYFFSWSIIREAPTPIPSQGRFNPNVDFMNRMARTNSTQAARPTPVACMNPYFFSLLFLWFD